MTMLIDTHAHLGDEKIENPLEVIDRAKKNGVEKIIVPTTSIADLDKAIKLFSKVENIYLLAGVHPEETETVGEVGQMIEELRMRIKQNKKIRGIGEIGLDFYWDKEKKTKEKQMTIFKAQLELAAEMNLPVAIHMRNSEKETVEVLENLEKMPKGQFHCFAGDADFLQMILHWGFYVSFAGNLTYKSAGSLRERLREVPADKLLLETDSPYLAPEPRRGTTNEPANVKILGEFIAQELNLPAEKISEITTQNTLCLYSLDTL